jgi:hypothetical protein
LCLVSLAIVIEKSSTSTPIQGKSMKSGRKII